MRSAFPRLGSALAVAFVVAACASGEELPGKPATEPSPTEPTTTIPSTTTPESAPEKECVAKCKTDSECANSCPAASSSGVNCCDVSTGTCYVNGSGVCPKKEDPDDPPPAY